MRLAVLLVVAWMLTSPVISSANEVAVADYRDILDAANNRTCHEVLESQEPFRSQVVVASLIMANFHQPLAETYVMNMANSLAMICQTLPVRQQNTFFNLAKELL